MKNNLEKKRGFTLIELLVFVTILSLFFVTAVSVAVASLRNIKVNEHRLLATRYADEVVEWLRSQKEVDWNNFAGHASFSDFDTYCFNSSPISSQNWPLANQACPETSLTPAIFSRRVVMALQGSGNQVHASVTVTWNDAGVSYSVPLTVDFAVWE